MLWLAYSPCNVKERAAHNASFCLGLHNCMRRPIGELKNLVCFYKVLQVIVACFIVWVRWVWCFPTHVLLGREEKPVTQHVDHVILKLSFKSNTN